MPDAPIPSVPSPASQEPAPSVDGVTAPPAAVAVPSPVKAQNKINNAKKQLFMAIAGAYACYILWCIFLLAALPNPTGNGGSLVSIGLMSCLAGVALIIGMGFFFLKRISSSSASIVMRQKILTKIVIILLPGFLFSVVTPMLIIREPSLPLDIVSPANAADLIAPVPVTLSAERAAGILKNLGYHPVKYQWDTDGDGKMNEETVTPTTTTVFERQGAYTAVVRVMLDGGDFRRIAMNIVIPQAVFSMVPTQPVVDKPVKFSVASLFADPKQLKEAKWDFGDGNPSETVTLPDVAHTYYVIGSYPVTATVQLMNQSQVAYKRTVTVVNPQPLPFPITMTTEPKTLIGPSPFGVLLRIDTKETLKEVVWSFGDGKEDRGASLLRESHEFDSPGIYPILVRARSADGTVAELTTLVRVTEPLQVNNLQFDGKPAVQGGKITGEIPLELSLTAKTPTPLVQFSWEVPPDANLQSQGATLTGVLRKEGTYTVILLAQGAEGKSMRMPITIEVQPPSAEPVILLTPDGGVSPLTVTFDASQTFVPPGETVAGFKWIYGDEHGGSGQAELAGSRVTHTYQDPGEYKVRLAVVLISGKEFTVDRTIIVRRPTLSACITATRLAVEVGKGIQFDSSCSTGARTSLVWDVRKDDQADTIQAQSSDPVYVYIFEEPGDFSVTLTLKDANGVEDKKTVSILVNPARPSAVESDPVSPEVP